MHDEWKIWQDGSPSADKSVEAVATMLGGAHIEGVTKGHDVLSGVLQRYWSFDLAVLRKRYGIDKDRQARQ